MLGEWSDPGRVADYLSREIPHRDVAEGLLLDALPQRVERVLDLGTGDGRLLGLVRSAHPAAGAVGIDSSQPMLARATERFASEASVELVVHDLRHPLTLRGPFDAVVSGLAIHHLEDARKRVLFGEIHALLRPGGVFANLDLVASATTEQHERFRQAIGREEDDPSDRLAGLCEQLDWLKDAGFQTVDCRFKWMELALIVAEKR
ncbi:MAG: class I SAM-dependent methyltransferase [Solirubrobacteraceae bacterium]